MNSAISQHETTLTGTMAINSPTELAILLMEAAGDAKGSAREWRLNALAQSWFELREQLPATTKRKKNVMRNLEQLPAAAFVGPTPPRHAVIQREQ